MKDRSEPNGTLAAGILTTAGLLAAGHWFPWWRRLSRLQAYTYGTLAILLGQGVCERFSRRWLRHCLIAGSGGAVVIAAYLYDAIANNHARRAVLKGRRDHDQPTDH